MKIVWIVSEGSPGHVSQSIGLVEAMKKHVPLQAVQVFGCLTARGWQRPLIRSVMGRGGRALPSWFLHRVAKIEVPSDAPAPDLIVSSGGRSVIPARCWARYFDVPYVFIGLRKPFPPNWFHTVITHVPAESEELNAIAVELLPTPVSPSLIASKGVVEKGTWAMIVGGASRSRQFKDEDWSHIAAGMNALARRMNVRWLLSTSRRTGSKAERILKDQLDPLAVKDAIWWSEEPRRELYRFMARSEWLFVTEDSITMVTEAVSTGKPVVALKPSSMKGQDGGFKEIYLNRIEEERRIHRLKTSELYLFSSVGTSLILLNCDPLHKPVNNLIQKLGWLAQ